INRGRKLDETNVSRMQIHMKFNVPVTQRDNGEIKRKAAAMTQKIDIRKKEAEVEALELANKKMRNDLEHFKQA
ncbi:5560_t:CDS:2, partial [Gigaspora margarita]